MRTVHKFPFAEDVRRAESTLTLELGGRSFIRHVGVDPSGDGFVPCLWIEHEPDEVKRERRFRYIGTGMQVPDVAQFVGTVITPRGLVWHVYEVIG